MLTEENWKDMWAEWQDKRNRLRANLELLEQKCEIYIDDLDDALTLITKLGILYETLSRSDKKELLRNVVERVVVNTEGEIARVDLLLPFAYLRDISEKVNCGEENLANPIKTQTGDDNITCSSQVLECEPDKTQSEHPPQYKTAFFLQQLIFPQSAILARLSNKR